MVKKDVYWEYLTEFTPRYHDGIVDRFLNIPENYLKPGGKTVLRVSLHVISNSIIIKGIMSPSGSILW